MYLDEFPTSFYGSGGHACADASGEKGRRGRRKRKKDGKDSLGFREGRTYARGGMKTSPG